MALGLEILAAGLALASAPEPHSVKLSAGQLFSLANAASERGDETTALRAYEALLADVSQEVRLEARFRLAMLESKRGNYTQAALHLRRILDQRPDASRVRLELAGLLAKIGDAEGAWRQVRAVQAGGLPPAVARLVDRYSEALRARRDFGGSLEIALAPDNNINHATSSETVTTVFGDFDIAEESRAKSGIGVAVQGQAYRRIPLGSRSSLLGRITGIGNFYKKRGFDDATLDIGVGPEFELGSTRLNIEIGANQRWFNKTPYMRSARLGMSAAKPIGRTSQIRLSGTVSLVDNRLNSLANGKDYSGEVRFEHAFSPVAGIAVSLSGLRESLKEPAYSTSSLRIGGLAWREIGRVTLTASVQLGQLKADKRLALLPERREERYSRLSLAAAVRRLEFHGFAPVGRFFIERNKSTIALYDFSRRRVEVGFERAF